MSEQLIQCVIVLYQCDIESAATLLSLQAIVQARGKISRRLTVLLYDNSPERQSSCPVIGEAEVRYVHDPSNPGLAKAYQYALDLAEVHGQQWLLLLDQDVRLTAEFFLELFTTLDSDLPAEVGAVVPRLIQGRLRLSPQLVTRFRNVKLPAGINGLSAARLTAFNAAACIKASAMSKIGGFPGQYPLDYQDHALFHYLQSAGYRVYVLASELEHRLSILNMEKEMPLSRYQKVLRAEWRFVRETGWGGGPVLHRLRLLKRAAREAWSVKNKQYARTTLEAAMAGR